MKYWKLLALAFVGLLAAVAFSKLRPVLYPQPDLSAAAATQFEDSCLLPERENRPAWECYEITTNGREHQAVTIEHSSGEQQQVLTFEKDGQTKFRFIPTQTGAWSFSTEGGTTGEITINAERPDYAKGLVEAEGSKWVRSATGEAFVPQFVMYDKPDLDAGLDEFVEGHGFTGFHITNLRDFMANPSYFEAVVLKTYRRGGVTHFWIWGDRGRNQTPDTYGIDADRLYTEIAARLGPIPGWTLSYGFDLFEWANAEEIEELSAKLQADCSYHHMVGGRGHKNQYKEISTNLDYASWEWHQPSYQDYREHLTQANQRPAFSEDRFRIRTPTRYPEKDYDPELTYQGLWYSAIAGGIANIWGHKPEGESFSVAYPNKEAIKTYSQFISTTFTNPMEPDNELINQGYCLRDTNQSAICFSEQPETISLSLEKLEAPLRAIAIDTRTAYEEIELNISDSSINWEPPYSSDWAFHISSQ